MNSRFPGAIPEIPVTNLDNALAYYQHSLGFTVDWGGCELGLAGISRDNCRLFLASLEYRKDQVNSGPILIWLNLDSKEDVDALYQTWTLHDAHSISPPESKPWGLHEFTVADLDGNTFRVFYDFATPARADS